jgi:hypothetical protein
MCVKYRTYVSRASNEEADTLANIGSQCLPIPSGVFSEQIVEQTIHGAKPSGMRKQKPQPVEDSGADTTREGDNTEPEEVMMVEVTWMQPYLAYMLHKTLPKDVVEAQRIVQRSKAFMVVKGELYNKSISGVCNDVLRRKRGRLYYTTSMQESMAITPAVEP